MKVCLFNGHFDVPFCDSFIEPYDICGFMYRWSLSMVFFIFHSWSFLFTHIVREPVVFMPRDSLVLYTWIVLLAWIQIT